MPNVAEIKENILGIKGLRKRTALFLMISEFFFPGLATIIFGVLRDMNQTYIIIGALQLLCVIMFGIGVIWAWVFGVMTFLKAAKDKQVDVERPAEPNPPPQAQSHVPPPPGQA